MRYRKIRIRVHGDPIKRIRINRWLSLRNVLAVYGGMTCGNMAAYDALYIEANGRRVADIPDRRDPTSWIRLPAYIFEKRTKDLFIVVNNPEGNEIDETIYFVSDTHLGREIIDKDWHYRTIVTQKFSGNPTWGTDFPETFLKNTTKDYVWYVLNAFIEFNPLRSVTILKNDEFIGKHEKELSQKKLIQINQKLYPDDELFAEYEFSSEPPSVILNYFTIFEYPIKDDKELCHPDGVNTLGGIPNERLLQPHGFPIWEDPIQYHTRTIFDILKCPGPDPIPPEPPVPPDPPNPKPTPPNPTPPNPPEPPEPPDPPNPQPYPVVDGDVTSPEYYEQERVSLNPAYDLGQPDYEYAEIQGEKISGGKALLLACPEHARIARGDFQGRIRTNNTATRFETFRYTTPNDTPFDYRTKYHAKRIKIWGVKKDWEVKLLPVIADMTRQTIDDMPTIFIDEGEEFDMEIEFMEIKIKCTNASPTEEGQMKVFMGE